MTYKPDTDTYTIFSTLVINCAIGLVCLLLFEKWRKQGEVFFPRCRTMKSSSPPPPSTSWFGWLRSIFAVSDDELLRMIGLDGYVFLRYLKMCFKIVGICAVVGLIVLVPSYSVSPQLKHVHGINIYSMSNVGLGGKQLWAAWIFTYVFTFIFLYITYKEYEHFAEIRKDFFRNGDPLLDPQMNYSVQVENVPQEYRNSKSFFNFVNELFPEQVKFASIAVDLSLLTKKIVERKKAVTSLENAIAAMEAHEEKTRPLLKLKKGRPAFLGCGSDSLVDAITYWEEEIMDLDSEVARLKGEARNVEDNENNSSLAEVYEEDEDVKNSKLQVSRSASNEGGSASKKRLVKEEKVLHIEQKMVSATGFVTFKSRSSQSVICQVPILCEKFPLVKAHPAPAPTDMIWSNITATPQHTDTASFFTSIFYYAGLCFWGLILTGIAGIAKLGNLMKIFPFLSLLSPVLLSVLGGMLPVVALIVFIALLPVIMTAISTYIEKRKSVSSVQFEVFNWMFLYQLANIFLILLSGSVLASLQQILKSPTSIVSLLGAAIPTVAVFFINFAIVATFSGIPIFMLRIGPMVVYKLYRTSCIFNPNKLTRRALVEGPLSPCSINYGTTLPSVLYIMCLSMLYWVIAPIFAGVATFYFGFSYIAWKYQYLYVVVRDYESGGRFWYGLYGKTMAGLMVATITMIGYLALKLASAQTVLLVPLPFIIIGVWRHTEKKFKIISLNFPYSSAVDLDSNGGKDPETGKKLDAFKSDYLRQDAMNQPDKAKPFPHRVKNIPLLDEHGQLNDVYTSDLMEEVNDASAEEPVMDISNENVEAFVHPQSNKMEIV
eukprot:gene15802-21402_t